MQPPANHTTSGGLVQDPCLTALNETDLDPNPIAQFQLWFQDAIAANLPEPNAMTLATSTTDGVPSARIVLLKDVGERGFVFFTNYESQKGRELAANPRAALVFFWSVLERQVRVAGPVSKVGRDESEAYFHSRPAVSQLGAWASRQSAVLSSRDELDRRLAEFTQQFADQPVPLPPYWGGFCLRPSVLEFWQARPNRLHDRFRYARTSDDKWRIDRLSP